MGRQTLHVSKGRDENPTRPSLKFSEGTKKSLSFWIHSPFFTRLRQQGGNGSVSYQFVL